MKKFIVGVFLCYLSSSAPAFAQVNATVGGTVSDSSGALLLVHSRLKLSQLEETAPIQRQAFNLAPRRDAADLVAVMTDLWRSGLDRDGFRDVSYCQDEIHSCCGTCLDKRLAPQALETGAFAITPHMSAGSAARCRCLARWI